MLYKYSVILDIEPEYYHKFNKDITEVLANYNYSHDELVELNTKEQLKYYINLYTDEETEKEKLLELLNKL